MKHLLLILLIVLSASPLHAQLELEAEGNLTFILDQNSFVISDDARFYPMPGLGIGGRYMFPGDRRLKFGLGLKYVGLGSGIRNELIFTDDNGQEVDHDAYVRWFFYDNSVGPTLNLTYEVALGPVHQLGFSTGFLAFTSIRLWEKSRTPWTGETRNSSQEWYFNTQWSFDFAYIMPFEASMRMPLGEHWMLAPKLTYIHKAAIGGSLGGVQAYRHRLALGCGFIWRK